MAHLQKEKLKEYGFIDYITDDGESKQDDEEDKGHDGHFDNHGDSAYDESEVVDTWWNMVYNVRDEKGNLFVENRILYFSRVSPNANISK